MVNCDGGTSPWSEVFDMYAPTSPTPTPTPSTTSVTPTPSTTSVTPTPSTSHVVVSPTPTPTPTPSPAVVVNSTTTPVYINTTTARGGGSWIGNTQTISERGVCWNTVGSPTTSGSHTTEGGSWTTATASWSIGHNMTGLSVGTSYYVRAYVYVSTTGQEKYGPQIIYQHGGPPP